MDAQLKRGILEICVLVVLEGENSYGYKIIHDLNKIIDISESTLYPILKRLESSGSLDVSSVEHNGRLRKYYRITKSGHNRISEFLDEWETIDAAYQFIKESHKNDNFKQ